MCRNEKRSPFLTGSRILRRRHPSLSAGVRGRAHGNGEQQEGRGERDPANGTKPAERPDLAACRRLEPDCITVLVDSLRFHTFLFSPPVTGWAHLLSGNQSGTVSLTSDETIVVHLNRLAICGLTLEL